MRRGASQADQEREASEACAVLCQRALQVIRASAHLGRPVDAPDEFNGDFVEWIRLMADACDGLARPQQASTSAADVLAYRRSVWNPAQRAWADAVVSASDKKYRARTGRFHARSSGRSGRA